MTQKEKQELLKKIEKSELETCLSIPNDFENKNIFSEKDIEIFESLNAALSEIQHAKYRLIQLMKK